MAKALEGGTILNISSVGAHRVQNYIANDTLYFDSNIFNPICNFDRDGQNGRPTSKFECLRQPGNAHFM